METATTLPTALPRYLMVTAALVCAAAVAGGAFGAHGLKARLSPEALEQWITAARYFMYAGLGALMASLATVHLGGKAAAAGWALLVGGAIFAGAVGGLALGAPRWFGAVAPLGGLGLIVGFVLLAWAVLTG